MTRPSAKHLRRRAALAIKYILLNSVTLGLVGWTSVGGVITAVATVAAATTTLVVGSLTITPAHAAQAIEVTESEDQYAKVTTLATEKFTIPDLGSFVDPMFAKAWLSVILDPGFAPSAALQVYFYRSHGWRFYDRAIDRDGKALAVDVLARNVQYGGAVVEQFMAKLSVPYLQSHRDAGLDIRFDGKGGSLVVQLPASYVQAMLDRLGDRVISSPATPALAIPPLGTHNGSANNPSAASKPIPPTSAPQKLRLGIRYLDEAMAAKMPEAARAKLPSNGLLLIYIEPASPAAIAGLAVGDVLTQFAGTSIYVPADMGSALEKVPRGGKVDAVINRGGKTITVVVQL
ncbi:PDZ domain-containing protein [Polynucleobacter sp. JS-Safj-400b-B2]|uniref:PDZ domain-containing protein n=1 Tax=Polynucleobacter sp. JS-Safj-400b-B2 TaxID=2576921 RepID=UPI001C0BC2E3|nr:PDZ domain-containing protein [Polynucleobacter sp. JS-Safj-400b-B2]MBU3626604.1 PDZ domain-containing protein [Polynucleobacter sp. JS-Safj-400b-B2]